MVVGVGRGLARSEATATMADVRATVKVVWLVATMAVARAVGVACVEAVVVALGIVQDEESLQCRKCQ